MKLSDPVVGSFSLDPAKTFWQKLAEILKEQARVIDRVFPPTVNIMLPFLERVSEDVISEYITPILDEAHDRDIEQYLRAVTGLLKQSMEFGRLLMPSQNSANSFKQDVVRVLMRVFDAHVDLYLQEELDNTRKKFINEVDTWEKKIKEQDQATETFFMSNINREADKRDFLSTFKKVILAPVSAIPSVLTFNISKPSMLEAKVAAEVSPYAADQEPSNRLSVMSGSSLDVQGRSRASSNVLSGVLPTTELAAKAAIMNTRLEAIKSLFSLELSIELVKMAKESLERVAIFAKLGGQTGEEAYVTHPNAECR